MHNSKISIKVDESQVGGWLQNAMKYLLALLLLETLTQILGGNFFFLSTKQTCLPMISAHYWKGRGWGKKINSVFADFE